jgi:hypothetical protein
MFGNAFEIPVIEYVGERDLALAHGGSLGEMSNWCFFCEYLQVPEGTGGGVADGWFFKAQTEAKRTAALYQEILWDSLPWGEPWVFYRTL